MQSTVNVNVFANDKRRVTGTGSQKRNRTRNFVRSAKSSKNLYLYLKVGGLVSSALNAHVSPMFVQPALERIDRWRHHKVLRKPVPVCDYSMAKWIFPVIKTTSWNCKFQPETTNTMTTWEVKNWLLSKFSLSVIILNVSFRSPLRLLVSKVVRHIAGSVCPRICAFSDEELSL